MPTTFTDDNGREWKIHLTLGKVKDINDIVGLDLLAPWDGKAIDAVTKNIFQFARIMALAVQFDDKADPEEQAQALSDGLRGEGLDRGIIAFWRDLSTFCSKCSFSLFTFPQRVCILEPIEGGFKYERTHERSQPQNHSGRDLLP